MIVRCCCCARQIVSYPVSNKHVVGGGLVTGMVGGVCCHECAKDLDADGTFPEEATRPSSKA